MGLTGEIWADAGLHINNGDFAQYAAQLQGLESKVSEFSTGTQALMAGAFLVPAGIVTGIAAYGTQIASSFQDAGTTLTTLYGSADVAREKFQWLSDFAANTPFEFPELLEATNRLKAYGIEAEDYMGVFGDTAAAMGKGIMDVVEAVADAQSGEFERMKEFGIKAAEITTKNYQAMGATAEQVGQTGLMYTDKFGKQQLEIIDRNNREMITSTITAIWNDKYAGAMEQRSKTLSGMYSTLKDNISMGLADLMGYDMTNMEVQTLSLMGVMQELMGVAVDLTSSLSDIPEPIQAIIIVAALGAAGIGVLAAGFIAYGAILPLVTADTAIFGVTLSAAIWPVTLIVGGLALLAGGLVLLEEKTGLVSTSWQLLSDMFTITWDGIKGVISDGVDFVTGLFDDLITIANEVADVLGFDQVQMENPFSLFGGYVDGFLSDVHNMAEGIRKEDGEIKASSEEAGQSTVDAAGTAEGGYSIWGSASDTLTQKVTGNNEAMKKSNKEAVDEFDKAFEKLRNEKSMKVDAGIALTKGVDIDQLNKGIELANGNMVILDKNNKLVELSANGVVKEYNNMGNVDLKTTTGTLHIMQASSADIENGYSNINQRLGEMNGKFVVLGPTINSVTGSAYTLNTALGEVNNTDFGAITGQFQGVNLQEANASMGAQDLKGWLVNVDNTSQANATGQIAGIGNQSDISSGQAGGLKTGLINVNNSSQANAVGQLSGIGSQAVTSTGQVGGLRIGLTNVNGTSMGGITVGVTGIGGAANVSSGNVSTLHGRIVGLNGISLDGIIGKLSSVISWADRAISRASQALGMSSSSSSSSSRSSSTVNNVKINTVNNNGTQVSQNAMRLITYGGV